MDARKEELMDIPVEDKRLEGKLVEVRSDSYGFFYKIWTEGRNTSL